LHGEVESDGLDRELLIRTSVDQRPGTGRIKRRVDVSGVEDDPRTGRARPMELIELEARVEELDRTWSICGLMGRASIPPVPNPIWVRAGQVNSTDDLNSDSIHRGNASTS
jgi:hypothetical protein